MVVHSNMPPCCLCCRSFTYEEFITTQAKFQKRQAEQLGIRNAEVARSIDDAIELVRAYPRENPDSNIDEHEIELFKSYYSNLMYKVCL